VRNLLRRAKSLKDRGKTFMQAATFLSIALTSSWCTQAACGCRSQAAQRPARLRRGGRRAWGAPARAQGNFTNGWAYTLVLLVTFWILYSYLVPISLFVTLEIVKFWQARRPPRRACALRARCALACSARHR
jgi:magnesium-transporting ATPase (P-type)